MNTPEPHRQAAGAEATYFAFIHAGEWKIQHCRSCNRHVFYPRQFCTHCHSGDLEWVTPTGSGTVYSLSQVASRDGNGPIVLLVDLDEGVRIMAGAHGDDAAGIRIGSRVIGQLVMDDGEVRIMFEPEREYRDA